LNPFKFTVSLRFRLFNKDMNTAEICDNLRLQPERQWTIGEPRKTPKGDPLSGVYDCSYCYFRLAQQNDEDLHEKRSRVCDELTQHEDFFHRIRKSGGNIEFFIGWGSVGNSGDIFDSVLLKKLAKLEIDLAIDVCGESAPQEDAPTEGHVEEIGQP